jgi:hypothetical protein
MSNCCSVFVELPGKKSLWTFGNLDIVHHGTYSIDGGLAFDRL